MSLKNYYNKIIKQELFNKFNYKTIHKAPVLEKIVLNFGCRSSDIKLISSAILALELITTQKGKITTSKKPNIILKLREGNPVGCKVTLKKQKMYNFFNKFLLEILPKLKNVKDLKFLLKKKENQSFSYRLENSLLFFELENNYYLFNNLSNLQINFVIRGSIKHETVFLLNSLKLNTDYNHF